MSKVEVNQVTQQCGTTLTVGGGACKTAVVDATTVTLGRCGGTVSLASGATQSGFGRTGTVDWQTAIQTSTPFTAATGKGYFINTTAGAITMNLPTSPSVGDIVAIKDYASTFDTNNLTIGRGGSNMNGTAGDSIRSTENESLTMVYADAAKGWVSVEEGTGFLGENFIVATGGTPGSGAIVCTNYKTHTFTGPGTFCVSQISDAAANNLVSYMVVAGGGGGGYDRAGGGGAGGFRELVSPTAPYTASPLDGYATPGNRITVTATGFPITVGGGGTGLPSGPAQQDAGTGVSSTFSTITSAGGGRGGSGPGIYSPGGDGGSGGGSDAYGTPHGSPMVAGSGNTPSTTPAQGTDGGAGVFNSPNGTGRGGGGGGATVAGTASTPGGNPGGAGATTSISATPTAYGGGGGGGDCGPGAPTGGTGGGGNGSSDSTGSTAAGINTGGGGGAGNGGTGGNAGGNAGGSGVVIIRYKFQ